MCPPSQAPILPSLKPSPKKSVDFARSDCPVACTLDVLGDRWTLLVVRDLLLGKRRYGDFLASPEGIQTNILAERLKRLEAAGLVERKSYQDNPPRHEYLPTTKTRELAPVLVAMAMWANRHMPGTMTGWTQHLR